MQPLRSKVNEKQTANLNCMFVIAQSTREREGKIEKTLGFSFVNLLTNYTNILNLTFIRDPNYPYHIRYKCSYAVLLSTAHSLNT